MRGPSVVGSRLAAELVAASSEVLGPRLGAVYAYGSAADGSAIPGFSDLDVAIFVEGEPSLDDARDLHRRLSGTDLAPYAYLQARYVDLGAPAAATLVPGSFVRLDGSLGDEDAYVHDDASLRVVAVEWLDVLPALVAQDTSTWSVATDPAHCARHVRLVTTRVKPAVRATLALRDVAPTEAYGADWAAMAEGLSRHDGTAAQMLRDLRASLPPKDATATTAAGELGLAVLHRLLALRRPTELRGRDAGT